MSYSQVAIKPTKMWEIAKLYLVAGWEFTKTYVTSFADCIGIVLAVFQIWGHTLSEWHKFVLFIATIVFIFLRVYYFIQAIEKRRIENENKRIKNKQDAIDLKYREMELQARIQNLKKDHDEK